MDRCSCQTAHCGRHKLHFDFGGNTFPTVLYRHSPQALCGLTADMTKYFREDGRDDVLAYGIAFYKKRCKVVVEKL